MHLISIKLAGFKSFVEPTTVELDPDVSVVVGPNGCGKSNILEAVRWVIGESSAHQLRGEVNSDFIFSGTESRAAASRASVELLFDNSDGKLGGDYASYAELSVRRDVQTEGQSTYFLNGQRCRRKDILDVFLGTGFGTRGYSIIRQNWVSQLVNSDPETLREHLEEAAGVSRYRARRHETLNKLNLTNQNLEQVKLRQADLAKELRQLKAQAGRARRSEALTKQLHAQKARLIDSKLRIKNDHRDGISTELNVIEMQVAKIDTSLQSLNDEAEQFEALLASQRSEQQSTAETRIQAQTLVNSTTHEIEQLQNLRDVAQATIDSKLNQLDDEIKLLDTDAADLVDLQKSHVRTTAQLGELLDRKGVADHDLGLVSLEFDKARAQKEQSAEQLQQFSKQRDSLESQQRVDEANLESLSGLMDSVTSTLPVLSDIEASVGESERKAQSSEHTLKALETELTSITATINLKLKTQASLGEELENSRNRGQDLREQRLSIKILQDSSLGQTELTDEVKHWLSNANLKPGLRIGELLDVEQGWESAVEIVLGSHIQGIATNDLKQHIQDVANLHASDVELVAVGQNSSDESRESDLTPLASRLLGDSRALAPLFKGIYTCETLEEATRLRATLDRAESVVTADNVWVGKHFIKVFRSSQSAQGVIERQRQEEELAEEISAIEQAMTTQQADLVRIKTDIEESEKSREALRERIAVATAQFTQDRTSLSHYRQQLAQNRNEIEIQQKQRVNREGEVVRLTQSIETAKKSLQGLASEHAAAQRDFDQGTTREAVLESEVEAKQQAFSALAEQVRTVENEQNELALKISFLERSQARQEELVSRLLAELRTLIEQDADAESRLPELTQRQLTNQASLTQFEEELSVLLDELRETERQVGRVRDGQTELTNEKNQLMKSETDQKTQLAGLAVEISQLMAERRELTVDPDLENEQVEENTDVAAIECEIESLTTKLSQLGLINYRATTELEERTTEKELLDAQIQDLAEAVAKLQQGIEKIDQESKRSLRSTFDDVNRNFGRLFRYLFGGGAAGLEFTDADIIQAGVIVRARPPGKNNVTINLLSDGERAMTAIAFVFALFELNPSPVCILDEVDAPFDERNVEKFTELLAKMSVETQFVVITHNPATMELAGNLLGITMEEPGVSRLVAVNLEDAFAMAANQ